MKILLVVLDNNNFIHYFPLGIAYLANVLRKEKHTVHIYNQDVNHFPDEHITNFLNRFSYDIVAVGSIAGYYPYKKLLSFSKAVNSSSNRNKFRYIIGGHMSSSDPEYFLEKTQADHCIVGEGEIAFRDINYAFSSKIIKGELTKDLDTLPFPAYDMFPMDYYRLQRLPNIENNEFSMSMITGRGCSFHCTFCYRLTPGIRLRSIESIVEEIKLLKRDIIFLI